MNDQNDEAGALEDILPGDLFNHPDCFDSRRYWAWESEVAAPKLVEMGYEVGRWWTGDGDSFGPLVRCVTLTKDGVSREFQYG